MEKVGTLPNADLPLRAAIRRLKAVGLLLLLGVIYALRPIVIVRFGRLVAGRLGHLAANTECYLCERDVRVNMPRRTFDIWTPDEPANGYLLKMYERLIFTWRSRIPGILCEASKFLDWWHEHEFSDTNMGRDIFNLFERIPAHLSFTSAEERRGQDGLRALGIPEGAKWVCLIVRDSAYLGQGFEYHDFRDTDVRSYKKAALALAARGYYVIRMGVKAQTPFNVGSDHVIDYAMTGPRSEFMDIYLGAKCEFCLSNATGFDAIPMVLRRPICFVNVAPIEYMQTYLSGSLAIWKHHFKDGKRMSVAEIIASGAGQFLRGDEFKAAGIELRDNSPEEIDEVAQEMVDRLATCPQSTYQSEFWDAFPRSDSPHTGRPLHGKIRMRIGSSFLNEEHSHAGK